MKKLTYYLLMLPATMLCMSCGGDEPEPPPEPQPQTVAVTGVTLSKTTLTLEIGASETLTATVAPQNAANKAVVWSSSNGAVASVDNAGKVTALTAGATTITVMTADGGKSATCQVSVNQQTVTGVSLDKTTLSLDIGASETLTATVTPADAGNKNVTWSSSDETVATVDATGKVTAVAAGTATITVTTADGGKSATCEVTVSSKAVTGVSLDKTTLSLITGDSETLTATVTPDDAGNKNVTWSSSNESVATVDNAGKVTAVAAGTTTITVTTEDGGKTATCNITVEAKYFATLRFDGKTYRIAGDNTCIFTRYSDEYYVVECSDAATKRALSISIAKNLVQGQSYDIYSGSPYIMSAIKVLFTEGETIAEESFWTEDISQTEIIGKLAISELTDELMSGTFNCRTMNGEITEGEFYVKAREWE